MIIEVLDIILNVAAYCDNSSTVVRALAPERFVGQEPEDACPLSPADFDECQRVFDGLVVVMEPLNVGRFVSIEEGWIVFGKHSLHAVDGDGVAVGEMDDELLD